MFPPEWKIKQTMGQLGLSREDAIRELARRGGRKAVKTAAKRKKHQEPELPKRPKHWMDDYDNY